jgi:NAD(P)-dependent dehydrogenase (short-subunit alcohol dehydrogenase family)
MGKRLEGKSAIITGATSGIGKASAELFAEEGARVIFAGRRTEEGLALESDLRGKGYDAFFVRTDVTVTKDLENLVAETLTKFGKIDILFNNAGINDYEYFCDMEMSGFDKIMDTNIRSVVELTKLVVPEMIKAGGGKIVNTASVGALCGAESNVPYCTSKAAVLLFTKSLAIELAQYKIHVNALMPGLTLSGMTEGNPAWLEEGGKNIPFKRVGEPREIAYGALFLASDEASYVTGAELVIDGGATA